MGGPTAFLTPPAPSPLRATPLQRHVGSTHVLGLATAADRGSGRGANWRRPTAETRTSRAALNQDGNGLRLPRAPRSRLPASARTYSASISTDLPLQEHPRASFDEYVEDRPRVFRAMFPDKRRSQRLNDEEWRIRMLPIQFLLLSAYPVIDMRLRCRSPSQKSPYGFPPGVTRVLQLEATRWELQGLDSIHMPTQFELNVQGVLYSDRSRGQGRSRLKGELQMSISLVLPAVLALIPDEVIKSIAESVLKTLVERMKKEVDASLLADYREFSKEMLKQRQMRAASHQPTNVPLKTD